MQGSWNAKLERMHRQRGETFDHPTAMSRQMREGRLLEFATFNNLVLTNTLGPHKPSRGRMWHRPDEKHHHQTEYILVEKRFRSGVNINRTRSFPGADIRSDHDLVMMTFCVRLKKARKPVQSRLRFDLEKLRGPDVACTFPATISGKFATLTGIRMTTWTLVPPTTQQ